MDFLDRPLLDATVDFDRLAHGQLDDFNLVRVAASLATPWKATTSLRRRLMLPFLFTSRAQWRAFRDFVAERKGCQEGFWVPTWLTDYWAQAFAPGDNLIDIDPVGLTEAFAADGPFGFMALIRRDGAGSVMEAHKIAGVTDESGFERMALTGVIGSFDYAQSICCALLYVRFAEDEIEYEFLTDQCIRCEVNFLELPREYVTSATTSRPITCYEITRGLNTWNLCNWTEAITDNEGTLWIPDNIGNGDISGGLDFVSESVQITGATDQAEHPMRYWVVRNALEKVTLSIYEIDADTLTIDRDDPVYIGRLQAAQYKEKGQYEAEATSIMRLSEIQTPRMGCQRTCNNTLFDVNCALAVEDFTTVGQLTALAVEWVEADEFLDEAVANDDPNWFALGTITVGTESRMCVGQDGNRLYIEEAFLNAQVGDDASATAGCDKRIGTCENKFDNVRNNVSMPYLPNSNPTTDAIKQPKPAGGKKG